MRLLNLAPLLSLLLLSGCAGMMTAMEGAEAMQNGTQADYIKKVGGKSAFETSNPMELSMLCGMYATSGKINTYVECTEELTRRFKDSTDAQTHFIVVNSQGGIALALNGQGRYRDAGSAIDRGLAILREKDLREDYMYGDLIKTSEIELHGFKAVVARKAGDQVTEHESILFVEKSLPWLDEQTLGLKQKTRKALGQVYFALEDYEKAAEFSKKLPPDEPSQWEKINKGLDAVLTLGLSLAIDAYADKKVEEAEKKATLAFDTGLYFQARADLEAQRYHEALDNFKALEDYTSISKDFNLHWMYWFDYARTYSALGEEDQAIAMLKKSIEVIESQRTDFNSEMGKMGFARGKQQPYELMIRKQLDGGNVEEAFAYVERAKARALVDLMASRDSVDLGMTPEAEQYIAQLQQAESRIQMSIEPSAEENKRGLKPKKQLKKKYPELASLISVDTLSSEEVGRLLQKGEVLVEYYIAGDDLFAFVLEDGKLKVYPLDGRGLAQNIRDYRIALGKSGNEWIKPSKTLYRQLLRPFDKRIHNKNLVIVPHGPLHYLPFASLHDGRHFVVNKARIRLMPSASVMHYVGKNEQTSEQMMILGNPDLNNPETDLPGAEQEAQAIAGLWSGVDIRLRRDATETAIKNNAGNYGMFHFASHGVFDPAAPLESSLLLAPDQHNDGHLTVAEIYSMKLTADLVTLSACETGLGDIVNGDDVVGLNRGFLYAGADSILASLWPVEDEPTAYFMESFYGYLKKYDKAKALQLAQIKTRKKYSHPSRWAAFQLTGAAE